MLDPIVGLIGPILLPTLVTILTALFGVIAAGAKQYLGQKTTDLLRKALDEAMNRSVEQALATGSNDPARDVVDYIRDTMSGTLKKLGASPDDLLKRARAEVVSKNRAPAPLPTQPVLRD